MTKNEHCTIASQFIFTSIFSSIRLFHEVWQFGITVTQNLHYCLTLHLLGFFCLFLTVLANRTKKVIDRKSIEIWRVDINVVDLLFFFFLFICSKT